MDNSLSWAVKREGGPTGAGWLLLVTIFALAALCGRGCVTTFQYDPGTVANFDRFQEWEKVDTEQLNALFDKAGVSKEDRKSFVVRRESIQALLRTARAAEEAKQR